MSLLSERRNFLKLAGAFSGSALLVACAPKINIDPTVSPPEPFPSGTIKVEPHGSFQTLNFGFVNAMDDYYINLGFDDLSEVLNHYNIPTGLPDGKELFIEIIPQMVMGGESEGVFVGPSKYFFDVKDSITISGGLFVEIAKEVTGHEPSTMQDMAFLSTALSVKMVGGLAQLAEQRGYLPIGEAKIIENKYKDDALNTTQHLVAGMLIYKKPPAINPVPGTTG
ncbi:MAG TPA: hypothetical protein VKC53_04205 [Patescibacteria group bacterium]|nr:hypothetical protein [Patescibacteria group bacterium]